MASSRHCNRYILDTFRKGMHLCSTHEAGAKLLTRFDKHPNGTQAVKWQVLGSTKAVAAASAGIP